MLAMSSAAPTPLPGHVAHQQRDVAVVEHEVVEEVAADFARRHRDALHFGEAEVQRRMRQHFVLNLPAELELAADAFLLHRRALVALDVGGHAVEGAARAGRPRRLRLRTRNARVVVALRDAGDRLTRACSDCA